MSDRRTITTDDLWELPRVGAPSCDDAGAVVVVPVTTHDADGTATTTLWLVGDGAPRALTTASAGAARVAPGGGAVAFTRPVDDRPQLHVLPLDGGEARAVTVLPLGVVGSPTWVDDRRLLVVSRLLTDEPTAAATAAWRDAADERPDVLVTERRVPRAWDRWFTDPLTEHVLLVDLDDPDGEPRDLTPGEWLLPDPLSDPGGQLVCDGELLVWATAAPDGDDDGVPVVRTRVVPLDGSAAPVELLPDAPAQVGSPRLLPDGRVLLRVQLERDFYAAPADLVAVDPRTGDHERLLDGTAFDLGVDGIEVGPDGRVVVATEQHGRGRLFEVADDGTTTPLAAPDRGGVAAPVLHRGGLLAVRASLLDPPEVVRVHDDRLEQLTSFTAPLRDRLDLGRVEERTVAGHAGADVQLLLVHPPAGAGGDEPGPRRTVHLVHGGPHGTFGDTWSWRWPAARWAAEGWLVAMVNFHGSTSFGHAFTRAIHGDWSTAPTDDVLAATDHLVAAGLADPDRVAIAGGSYGGYLVTWLTTVTDRFVTSVAHAAVTDFGGMWATDWNNGFADAFGATLWEDPEASYRHSPNWRYGRITTPTLVLHGERDLRVPIDQGRSLYGVLQSRRVPSRLVVFPGENHWILHRDTSTAWFDEVLGWLHRHLDDASVTDGGR